MRVCDFSWCNSKTIKKIILMVPHEELHHTGNYSQDSIYVLLIKDCVCVCLPCRGTSELAWVELQAAALALFLSAII